MSLNMFSECLKETWMHQTTCCEKAMTEHHLLWLQVTDDGVNAIQYLINERHNLSDLNLNKMTTAFLRYFDERVTRHVLNTIMCLCTNPQHMNNY